MPTLAELNEALTNSHDREHGPCLNCGEVISAHTAVKYISATERDELPQALLDCVGKAETATGMSGMDRLHALGRNGFVPDPEYRGGDDLKAVLSTIRLDMSPDDLKAGEP